MGSYWSVEGSIMDFLGVLDRRLYEVELVKGLPESFRAASRSRGSEGSVEALHLCSRGAYSRFTPQRFL